MSQPQTVESPSPVASPAANMNIQHPPQAYDRESLATTMQGSGPAPAKEMPANLINSEPNVTPSPGQKEGPAINTLPNTQTVTPLHMLADTPQWIDCPFCQRRTLTRIDTEGTAMQMVAGALCCLLCVCLACVPCMAGWCENMHYFCSNCNQKVATRPYDGTIQVFGPQMQGPVSSQYQTAPPPVPQQ